MTKHELNRDVKRLFKNHFDSTQNGLSEEGKREFLRLYHADSSFEYLTIDNLKRLLRFNLRHRVIQLHSFGLMIDEKKL